ncbi:MAG: hypothetical protein NVS9B12_09520 [Vulcanimicrobiaceae bacterium]
MLDNIELNANPAPMATAVIDVFERDGFLRLKEFFSPTLMERHGSPIALPGMPKKNAWRANDAVKEFVHGKRLAGIAAQLLGVMRVRLLGDEVFCQQPGAKETEWRVGQGDDVITVWVPLQETTLAMGPIAYAAASHHARRPPEPGRFRDDAEPYELGELSFHSGWTYYRFGANTTSMPSWALAITYAAADVPDEVVDAELNPVLN